MANLPLGDTSQMMPSVMLNILGDQWFGSRSDGEAMHEPDWLSVLAVPGAKLHLYGKREARRGRKMGHVTCVAPTLSEALARAQRVAGALRHRTRSMRRRASMNTPAVDAAAIERAVEVLRRGGLVAVPTETVYGLAADADNDDAVRKLFAAKGRPADHPVIVHVDDVERVRRMGHRSSR